MQDLYCRTCFEEVFENDSDYFLSDDAILVPSGKKDWRYCNHCGWQLIDDSGYKDHRCVYPEYKTGFGSIASGACLICGRTHAEAKFLHRNLLPKITIPDIRVLPDYIVKYQNAILRAAFVGSKVTCDPAPTDTDTDILVLTTCFDDILSALSVPNDEWENSGSDVKSTGSISDGDFVSYKKILPTTKEEINLIVVQDSCFYDQFLLASAMAKERNLLTKEARIALFQDVLYGNRITIEEAREILRAKEAKKCVVKERESDSLDDIDSEEPF